MKGRSGKAILLYSISKSRIRANLLLNEQS
nr:unnamed protein product [Callosobruchus chinensis]